MTKKQIVEVVNRSFEDRNIDAFLEFCTDDVKWTVVGEKSVIGKAAIREWLSQSEGCDPPQFTVITLIAEDDIAICNGDMTMKETNGPESRYGFCDVYRFSDGRIAELTTYIVQTNKDVVSG